MESTKPVQTLFNAVSSSKLRLVRLLIEGGVDVNARNDLDQTPLLIACSSVQKSHFKGETREKVARYLIAAGANVNVQDKAGRTPLIYAAITQAHASVIFDLVAAGAQLWLEDEAHRCALDYALQRPDLDQVGVIVEAYKRFNSNLSNDSERSHIESAGILRHGKSDSSCLPRRGQHDKKASPENEVRERLQATANGTKPSTCKRNIQMNADLPKHPTSAMISCNVPQDEHLCDLCKNLIPGDEASELYSQVSSGYSNSTEVLDSNFLAYELSGLLYRRRSTGSLFAMTEQRCETIRRKKNLGITLEDLFSTIDINQPSIGEESLYVKSPLTNELVDISNKALSPPLAGSRVRSISLSLPPADNTSQGLRFLGDQGFSFSAGGEPLLLGHELLPRPTELEPSVPDDVQQSTTHHRKISLPAVLRSRLYLASDSDDEDCDDILVVPSAQFDMTSSKDRAMYSDRSVSPQEERTSSPGTGTSESGGSNSCSSPIPRIVLTDFVASTHVHHDE